MANLIVENFLPATTLVGAPGAAASATSGNGLGNTGWEFQKAVQFDAAVSFQGGVSGLTGPSPIISGSGATVTLTSAQSGSTVLLDRAAGIVFTLPAPQVGLRFSFYAPVSVTSNNYKIITDAGTTLLIGSLVNIKTDLTTLFSIGDGATHVSLVMNGTTTGGLKGTYLRLTCVSSTSWCVEGSNLASGTIATPFATS